MGKNQQSHDDEANLEAEGQALADKILDNFELPESLANRINEAEEENEKGSSDVEDDVEEGEAEEETETPETTDSEEDSDDEDEELIPKSKFQRRLDEMTREKRVLEARLRKLEEAGGNQKPVDEDIVKLEKMSEAELVALKKQVRVSQIKSRDDDATLNQLLELEEKIDGVMRTSPQRFNQNQVNQFNEAVAMSSQEIKDFPKVQKDIFGLAKRIYDTAPELHSSVNGQARAWNLAVEHYKLLQETQMGKTKITELSREKNTLKRKVSGNNISRKVNTNDDSDAKLFKKAKNGETRDKVDFIRKITGTDAIVDNFMSSR